METQASNWLPLTEYALRSGMSISTLRRKIKSNTIEYKMEDGRYLLRGDEFTEAAKVTGFASTDQLTAPRLPSVRPSLSGSVTPPQPARVVAANAAPVSIPASVVGSPSDDLEQLRAEFLRMQEDNLLRWKALEARVSGLAKKLEFFSEQMAETKMLVKLFEEKLDQRA